MPLELTFYLDEKLNFIEEPFEIMDREVKRLKQSRIPIDEGPLEFKKGSRVYQGTEDQMQKKYHHPVH
ncbi:hypothetical protein Tco_1143475 [Tanacetum coccineum]